MQKKKEMYLWCVSSWRLFFKVNRSNLCLESPCFFMPKGAELRDHYRISYWDITRKHFSFCVCFDVYYTSSSCFYVSLFCILFILILKAMSIFFLWNMCLALGIYNIWGTISCSVLLYCVKQQKKPTLLHIANEMSFTKQKIIKPKQNLVVTTGIFLLFTINIQSEHNTSATCTTWPEFWFKNQTNVINTMWPSSTELVL